jgi:preprotein translocase subunit SecG
VIQLECRARAYQPLTPAERAVLRLLETLAYVALIGAATAAAQYFAKPAGAGGAINWATVGRVCAAGAALAVLMALAKYFKAHGDPALAGALTSLAASGPASLTATSQPIPLPAAPSSTPDPTAAPALAPAPSAPANPAPPSTPHQ